MKRAVLLMGSAALLAAAPGCANMQARPSAAPAPAPRYVHQVDIPATVRPFLSPQGFMDPAFPPTVANPSEYLTDFFGLQAIADVPMETIVADFVPRHATEVARDAQSVTLRFQPGYTAKFYPNSSLSVMGANAPVSHAQFSGDSWREIRGNIAQFTELLRRNGLAERYLVPNRSHADEVATARQRDRGVRARYAIDPQGERFRRTPDAILLAPETVHGRREDADKVMQLLAQGGVDWIGLEMLMPEHQAMLDAFHRARAGTGDYQAARQRLIDHFATSWNGRAGPRTSGEENYYFQLVEAAKRHGVRVIAIEDGTAEFLFFRYGETSFGGAVRSYIWAKHVPPRGRGIIFGGSAHFKDPAAINVQDFIAARQPRRQFFSIVDLTPRRPAAG